MKIAFYLGSFNPFHNGHLEVIKRAFTEFGMDEVVIVPTMKSPWKYNKILGIYDRGSIISLSINRLRKENNYNITIDYVERDLKEPYYSYITLEKLQEKYGAAGKNDLFFLCGEDVAKTIIDWKNGEQILKDWTLLVVERPAGSISSSMIRKMIKECKDISPYVSRNAIKIITRYYKYGLYNTLI